MRQVFPIAYNNISYKQGEIVDASDSSYDLTTELGRKKLWDRLNKLKSDDELKSDRYDLIIGYIENRIIVSPTDVWQGYTYGPPSSIVVNSDEDMQATVAHEVEHIFGIADEYLGQKQIPVTVRTMG